MKYKINYTIIEEGFFESCLHIDDDYGDELATVTIVAYNKVPKNILLELKRHIIAIARGANISKVE